LIPVPPFLRGASAVFSLGASLSLWEKGRR
jgi:hypothetical protein